MKNILSYLFLVISINTIIAQSNSTAFYSSNLSQKDIFDLVDDRKKWRKKAKEFERILEHTQQQAQQTISLSENEKKALKKSNRRLYEEKSKIEGLLILTAQNYERAKQEVNRLQRAKELDQKALVAANQKVEELTKIIHSQKGLISKYEKRLGQLQALVKAMEKQLLEKEAFLRQTKLQIFKSETDILMVTNKFKNTKSSFKDNNNSLPFPLFRRKIKLIIRSGIFLEPQECEAYSKHQPEAEFYLYKLGSAKQIGSTAFKLEFSKSTLPPLLTASNDDSMFTSASGKLYWGIGELALDRKKLGKGDYYYILDIEGQIMLTGILELD